MQILPKQVPVLMLIVISSSMAADEPMSVQNLSNKVRGIRIEELDRRALPQGKEKEVLAILRKERAYATLFRLNDQPAIDEFIAKYRQKKGLDWRMVQLFERCKAPFILDELAPSLYEGPDFENRINPDQGYTDQGYAATTAVAMSAIIANAPELPEAVRKSIGNGVGPRLMRAWWEENQQALREERYGDVKPVNQTVTRENQQKARTGEPPTRPSPIPLEQPTPRNSTTPPDPVQQGPVASAPVPAVVQTPAVAVEQRAPVWPWVLAILVLAGSAEFAWKRRA